MGYIIVVGRSLILIHFHRQCSGMVLRHCMCKTWNIVNEKNIYFLQFVTKLLQWNLNWDEILKYYHHYSDTELLLKI